MKFTYSNLFMGFFKDIESANRIIPHKAFNNIPRHDCEWSNNKQGQPYE